MRAAMKLTSLSDPAEAKLERLDAHPKYIAAHAELAALERRFAEAQQRERVAAARSRGQAPTRSIAERAQALVAGGQVTSLSPAAEREAAHEEMTILRHAIFAARERLDAVAGEISQEVCSRFAVMNADALRNALAAATALHEALQANRILRARLITSGYQINEAVMPSHWFPAAAAVGDPAAVGMTPAAQFRSWLIERKIL
jgi:hypothetical protein